MNMALVKKETEDVKIISESSKSIESSGNVVGDNNVLEGADKGAEEKKEPRTGVVIAHLEDLLK